MYRRLFGKLRIWLLISFLAWEIPALAQVDSAGFEPERFGKSDLSMEPVDLPEEITSATRTPADPDELPVQTIIVTAEEIRKNGYHSLGDVLRNIPGFRTSQPGSAFMGDMFLMRGLLGNVYTKILINGVPILPSAAPGMPLGSQLPIRQAERIEIILGPSASLFGNDAIAGVINIVLPDVDRPVEATGSVAFGSSGHQEIHLFVGGKAGKDDKILQYSLYGSMVEQNDLRLDLPDSLIEVDSIALSNPLYLAPSLTPRVTDFTHTSRMLGATFKFRGLRFSSESMFRKDHAGLGAHPEEVAYDNPNSFFGELINSNRLTYQNDLNELGKKGLGRLWILTNLTALLYRVDRNSNFNGIEHPISNFQNYIYAESNDFFAEQLINYSQKLGKPGFRLDFLGGGAIKYIDGISFHNYLSRPFYDTDVFVDTMGRGEESVQNSTDQWSYLSAVEPLDPYQQIQYSGFFQAGFTKPGFNITASMRLDKVDTGEVEMSPRVSAFWKPAKWVAFRGQYSNAFRDAGSFYLFNNYRVTQDPPAPGDSLRFSFKRIYRNHSPERLNSIEAGVTFFTNTGLEFELYFFRHVMENTLFTEISFPPNQDDSLVTDGMYIGYSNRESKSYLNSFSGKMTFTTGDVNTVKMVLYGQYNLGNEEINDADSIPSYRGMPKFMAQANLFFDFPKIARLSIFGKYVGSFTGTLMQQNNVVILNETDGFFNLDVTAGRSIARRVSVYLRVLNVLNTTSKGLYSNSFLGSKLSYIPQPRRSAILGLNFDLIPKDSRRRPGKKGGLL